jgi:hypothetical protein
MHFLLLFRVQTRRSKVPVWTQKQLAELEVALFGKCSLGEDELAWKHKWR